MDSYGVVIDYKMINNIFETQTEEVYDLINLGLLLELFIFGILPAFYNLQNQTTTKGSKAI